MDAGQRLTTISELSIETGLTYKEIRTCIDKLKRTGEWAVDWADNKSLVTVINWAKYQGGSYRGADVRAGLGAHEGHTKGTRRATGNVSFLLKEECKNERMQEPRVDFIDFWKLYPRKESKVNAQKVWEKLKPDSETFEKMKASINSQTENGNWSKDRIQFIPHPSTWLNQKRWEDEVPEYTSSPNPQKPKFDYAQREYKKGELDSIIQEF